MNIYTPRLVYYIYAYLRKDGTPYYIGKGKNKRAWSLNHTVSLPKDKSRIVIIEANLTEIGSFALERRLIRWYGRKDNSTGILRNRTDGGEGGSGAIVSDETRRRMSLAQKGHISSDETRLKISELSKGRKHSKETRLKIGLSSKGRIPSDETRLKISAANRGKKRKKSGKIRIFSEETKLKMSASAKGRVRSEEHNNNISESKSKTWNLIDPNGNQFTIKNLAKFCRENNLTQPTMSLVAKGEKNHHKGWKVHQS